MSKNKSPCEIWIREHFFINIEVSAALWVHIHCFEITLRNFLDNALSKLCSRLDWWNLENFLARRELTQVNRVLEIRKFGVSDKSIILRLALSFWVSLLTKRYHHKIWNQLENSDGLKNGNSRERIQAMASEILALRNQIAHQKYILNRNLMRDYTYLHELTTLLNPQLAEEVQKRSRVLDLLLNARLVGSGGGI